MSAPTLFTLESTPTPPERHPKILRLGRKPQPRTCPTCNLTILAALSDGGLTEAHVDPHALTLPAVQAAHLLGITIYRTPVNTHGQAQELWWTHPADPIEYAKFAWLPAHQCGRPPLPGHSIPVWNPNAKQEAGGPPPY